MGKFPSRFILTDLSDFAYTLAKSILKNSVYPQFLSSFRPSVNDRNRLKQHATQFFSRSVNLLGFPATGLGFYGFIKDMDFAVVIPTYNEAGNVLELHRRLRLSQGDDVLCIFVDDSSEDGTSAVLTSLNDPHLILISRPGKQGLGSAYREGFAKALELGAILVAQMDADLSHAPEDLIKMRSAAKNSSLVIGSRYIEGGEIVGWGPWRYFCSRAAIGFARFVLGLEARDITSGFRIWNAGLLRTVLSQPMASDGYAFQEEMLFRAQKSGASIVEVPIVFRDRQAGESKLHWREVVEFFKVMKTLRKQK